MTVGQKIYELRNEKHMTQEELAERMGVSRQSVSKWESDTSLPELEKLKALAELFEVSLDKLVNADYAENAESKATPKATASEDFSSDIKIIRNQIDTLNKKVKQLKRGSAIKSVAIIILAIALIINSVGHRNLSDRIGSLDGRISAIGDTVYYPGSGDTGEKEKTLVEDWKYKILSFDEKNKTAEVSISMLPVSISKNSEVTAYITGSDGNEITTPLTEKKGRFTGTCDLPIEDYYEITVVFDDGENRQSEVLSYDYSILLKSSLIPNYHAFLGFSDYETDNGKVFINADSTLTLEAKDLDEFLKKGISSVEISIVAYDEEVEEGTVVYEKTLTEDEISALKENRDVPFSISINKKTDNVCLALRIETKTDYLDTPIVLSTDIFEECNDYYMENTEVIEQE